MTTNHTHTAAGPAGEQQPVTDAQRQLEQIAALVDEYAESAPATGNADLMILLFQICMVLGDDPAEAGRRISGMRKPPTCWPSTIVGRSEYPDRAREIGG